MKKIFTIAMLFLVNSVLAQNAQLTNKKGHQILPRTGDFSVGVNANPLLDFALNAVNIMNNTGQTAELPAGINGISMKYFLKDNIALRASVELDRNRGTYRSFFDNPIDVFNEVEIPGELVDVEKWIENETFVSVGFEMRRGYNRLQGYYGADIGIQLMRESETTEYGQAYTKEAADAGYMLGGDERLLSYSERVLAFGLRPFVGVEYFIAPKISLGAEYGLNFARLSSPRGDLQREIWDDSGSEPKAVIEIDKTDSYSDGGSFNFNGNWGNGQITLHFYF